MSESRLWPMAFVGLLWWVPALGMAQPPPVESEPADTITLQVVPAQLTLGVGERATLEAVVTDANGTVVDDVTVIFFSRSRRGVGVTRAGEVRAYRPGEFTLVAMVPDDPDDASRRPDARVRIEIPITVPQPPVTDVAVSYTHLPLPTNREV